MKNGKGSKSGSDEGGAAAQTRPYALKKRAEKREETRRRIVDATVELHSTLGPARTSLTQIAELARVQRHTLYAHFPDERSLFLACSGRALERDPLPDVEAWVKIPAGPERIATGLGEVYSWFDRNSGLAGCILRDCEHHALTREMIDLRMTPVFARAAEILGEGVSKRGLVMLGLALDFACWRALSGSLAPPAAARLMRDSILALKD